LLSQSLKIRRQSPPHPTDPSPTGSDVRAARRDPRNHHDSHRTVSHGNAPQGIPLEEKTSMASRRRIRQRFALASQAAHNHRLRLRPALEALEPRVVLSTFTVDLTTDTAPTTGGSGSGLAGDLRY
jgi:hypothetical protein